MKVTARIIQVALLTLAVAGCGKKSPIVVIPPLPRVSIADVSAPPSATVVVQQGSTLQAIATAAYHHEDFSGFVGQLNGIAVPERLRAGTTLKTPSLPVAFRDAGLDASYQPAVNALAKAWLDLVEILPAYVRARDSSGANDGETFAVPVEIKTRLIACADAIDASVDVLMHPKSGPAPSETLLLALFGAVIMKRFWLRKDSAWDSPTRSFGRRQATSEGKSFPQSCLIRPSWLKRSSILRFSF